MFYRRKTLYPNVEAHQLTVENMASVAAWSCGSIKGMKLDPQDRVVDIQSTVGEERANVGDFVCHNEEGFYVLPAKVFLALYEEVSE